MMHPKMLGSALASLPLAGALSPAGQIVATAASGVAYFPWEKSQLTPEAVNNIAAFTSATTASIFSFANTGNDTVRVAQRSCKLMPGDPQWPSDATWEMFGELLGDDALIKAVPAAAVCYPSWPEYDETACAALEEVWEDPTWHANQPIDPDWPLFEGVSCVPPFVNRANGTCVLGGQPSYVVNVSTGKFKSSILAEVDHSNIRLSIIMAQIQLAVNFARNLNLRLNVKNKGHDFNAKSTGGGALSIWTTWLQDIEYLGDEQYGGQALKIGSGVSAEQLYKFVDGLGLMVTGPIARTVGLSGGYLLGGGNSPLIGKFGMGADQIISMEVVLPDGTLVSVSEKLYPELFYALRGGGGATYGVVTSYVIRVYQTIPMSSLTYSFSTGGNVSADIFWKGVDAISTYYAEWAKLGLYTYWMTTCTDKTTCTFVMNPQYAPNMTTTELAALNVPFFSNMSDLGIPLTGVNYTDWPSYLEFFEQTWPESTSVCGVWTLHTASRFFPQSVFEDITKFNAMTASIRNVSETRGMVIGYNIQPGVLADPFLNQTNAVSPAWREIVLYVMSNYMWDTTASPEDIAADNKLLVDALDPWREIAPNAEGGGAYLNEADINEPDFQHAFWGSNYEYLYEVKQRYDPWGVFYAATAVGSEDWYITDQIAYYPTQYGRLCPVQY